MTSVSSTEDLTALRTKLDVLSRRLDVQTDEFQQSGEFLYLHRELMAKISKRHDSLRRRVETAARQGTTWDLIKAEFARDFSSIFDDLLLLEQRLEASMMRATRSPRHKAARR